MCILLFLLLMFQCSSTYEQLVKPENEMIFFSLTGFTHTHTNKFNIFELFFAVTLITLFLWLCNLSIYSMHALCSIAFNNTKLACLLEQPAAKTHKNSSSSVLSSMQAAVGWLYYTLDPPSMPDPQLALIGSSIFEMNLSK